MNTELSTKQLSDALAHVLAFRCEGIDPTQLNLRFCPTMEACCGPECSATLRYRTYPWMANPMGVTHGGMISAILDASMGTLCAAVCDGLAPTTTMTTNYCRPVPLDTEVLVKVRLTYRGGTSAQLIAELSLPGQANHPLATATGVYYTAHIKKFRD